jgi:ribulose-5-phosphate 4-epimerase/fuculose-1-phosphate aldolase
MADGDRLPFASVKGRVSEAEWTARVELAALYRLMALEGWDDMICTHVSARIPGPENHFLINPYGLYFDEITASNLVKVTLDGQMVDQVQAFVNFFGFNIHAAVYAARPEVQYVSHLHTDYGVAVSAQTEGLLPISQHALAVLPLLGYHDYKRPAVDSDDCERLTQDLNDQAHGLDERERLTADLGTHNLLLMRNHGTLALGRTAADCWTATYYLEKACRHQVLALTAGREGVTLVPHATDEDGTKTFLGGGWTYMAWPGSLRRLARLSPGYDA